MIQARSARMGEVFAEAARGRTWSRVIDELFGLGAQDRVRRSVRNPWVQTFQEKGEALR
jgi:hypothetical protein